jgi:hypothetical protein
LVPTTPAIRTDEMATMRSLAPPAWWLAVSMKFLLRRCTA